MGKYDVNKRRVQAKQDIHQRFKQLCGGELKYGYGEAVEAMLGSYPYNLALDAALRKNERDSWYARKPVVLNPESILSINVLVLLAFISELPAMDADIINMRYRDKLTLAEVGKRLGRSGSYVQTQQADVIYMLSTDAVYDKYATESLDRVVTIENTFRAAQKATTVDDFSSLAMLGLQEDTLGCLNQAGYTKVADLKHAKRFDLVKTIGKYGFENLCKAVEEYSVACDFLLEVDAISASYANNKLKLAEGKVIAVHENTSIAFLGFSGRLYNCLMRRGYSTVGDVKTATKQDLASIRHLGSITLAELRQVMSRHNIDCVFMHD